MNNQTHAGTAAQAEADVERARAELTTTLEQLRTNLRPSNLVHEVMERPKNALSDWIGLYNRFAARSPVSGLIIGSAVMLLTRTVARKQAARR